ncbi:Hypothetical protein MCYN_0229 [Mycoplasmopsis cynos C142]|uniref:Uncharacterized protein n=1 Tax=Mycoplasmopsis cynos (strain C142) TaxID=1246955 RepID=L0RWG7_MYCC1|nr:Hypothetical protein MCYN_0229 [Mycoplasmopsis cynos C142]
MSFINVLNILKSVSLLNENLMFFSSKLFFIINSFKLFAYLITNSCDLGVNIFKNDGTNQNPVSVWFIFNLIISFNILVYFFKKIVYPIIIIW